MESGWQTGRIRAIVLTLENKKEKLRTIIRNYKHLLVAFSGGVDSTFLLAVAFDVLKKNTLAVTGSSAIHPQGEIEKARLFASHLGVPHITLSTHEMTLPEFLANTENRCYVCKKHLIEALQKIAMEKGIAYIAHGANVDDLNDFRPGFRAAQELGVVSPLIEAGLSKDDIRRLSKEMGLETWNKPAQPCLATRLPYGTAISEPVLKKIAAAEKVFYDLGIPVVRVRHHDDIARIEVSPDNFETILTKENCLMILNKLKNIGYLYVSLDLEGYHQGSLNRSLSHNNH